MIKVTPL